MSDQRDVPVDPTPAGSTSVERASSDQTSVTQPAVTERTVERGVPGNVAAVEHIRGGLSLWSILSGVLVAIGAFIVISAIVGGILALTGVAEGGINANEARDATLGVGIGLVIAQFLSFLWGGYTAGRMARGSGVLNGLLVPVVAIVLIAILGAIVTAVVDADVQGAAAQELPLPLSTARDLGTGIGIGLLAAALIGGALGGGLGARWHTRLENEESLAHRDNAP